MSRPALLAIALGAASAASGCDLREAASAALAGAGQPSFREIEARQAHAAVRAGALLLQARGAEPPARRAAGARLVDAEAPLDERELGHRIVVLSEEPELGLRLGAQLARAGAARVAVVAGGLPAWNEQKREE